MRFKRFTFAARLLVFLVITGVPGIAFAQKAAVKTSERTKDFKLESKLMKREMPYRVILPANYNAPREKSTLYPTLYLLHGLTGRFDNWSTFSKIAEYSKTYGYIIVMPEGKNGWYSDSAKIPNDKYESYIVEELIPKVESDFRAMKTRESRAIAGLSMGGFGAMKFAMKYPDKFVVAGSFSGALRAAEWSETELTATRWKVLIDSISSTFGDSDGESRRSNDLFGIVKAKSATEVKSLPFLYIDCGTEDFLVLENQRFAKLLLEKKVRHEFRQLPGRHDWKFWDAQIQEFLKVSKKFIK